MDDSSVLIAAMERDAAAYDSLRAGFGAFTLHRVAWPDKPGETLRPAVYRSDEPSEVDELRRLLAAHPSGTACLCWGSASIKLEGSQASAELNVNHGESVRWRDARSGDFELERGRELAEWMAVRGVPEIRDEMDQAARLKVQAEAEWQAWVAAMPAAVRPYTEAMLELTREGVGLSAELLGQLSQALRDAEPDDERRIRAVLTWRASGSGGWFSGWFHESVPGRLLMAETPDALLGAFSADSLSASEIGGAARLVVLWPKERQGELGRLPQAAWDRLAAAAADDQKARDALAHMRADT